MIQLPLKLNIKVSLVLIVFTGTFSSELPQLPPEIHSGINSVIEHVFTENRKAADDEAKRLMRKFPEHPAGYFCMAFILDNWMAKYQTDKKEDDFYKYCDLAIEKGEKSIKNSSSPEWARFFIAAADGFKGTYEARYERWITAFRFGWKGVSALLDMEANGCVIPDIYYGIGSYNYWRSALMKTLWWMPGIEDKRSESIAMLYKVSETGIYTRTLASTTLVEILLNENRFDDALALAEKNRALYPNYVAFSWGKARALFGLKKYDSAITTMRELIAVTENDPLNNHFNEVMYHTYIAKIYLTQNKSVQALAECNTVKNFTLESPVKKRLENVLNEIKNV
jgi:tetratricopeptide (TPR) repeat protein